MKKPPNEQSLPRLEAVAIPPDLTQSPQMTLCLLSGELIGEKAPSVPDNMWKILGLGTEWRHGRENYVAIYDPGNLFNFLAQYSRAAASLQETHAFCNLQKLERRPLSSNSLTSGVSSMAKAKAFAAREELPPTHGQKSDKIDGFKTPMMAAGSGSLMCYACGRMGHKGGSVGSGNTCTRIQTPPSN